MIPALVVSFITALTISGTAIHFLLPETSLSADTSSVDSELLSPLAESVPDILGAEKFNVEPSPSLSTDETLTSPSPSSSMSPSPRTTPRPTVSLTPSPPLVSPEASIIPSPTARPSPTETATPRASPLATVKPTSTPLPKASPVTGTQLDEWFNVYAAKESISSNLLRKIALCESRFNQLAKNGDYGGMYQFATGTWISTRRAMNLNTDPSLRFVAEEAIKTAAFRIATSGAGAWPNCSK